MLKILIISENMERSKMVMDTLVKRENDLIVQRERYRLFTVNTVYNILPPVPNKIAGFRADQIILDYYYIHILKRDIMAVLASSCVPESYQIIDDRTILR